MNRIVIRVVVALAMMAGLIVAPIVPTAVEGQAESEPGPALAVGDASLMGWDDGPATGC